MIFCPILAIGQNIIQNGDFESYIQCPEKVGQLDGYVEHWTTYFGTPDYLNCDFYGNAPSFTPEAHSGKALVSCLWYDHKPITPNVPREYLIQSLAAPLEKKTYYIYFYIYLKETLLSTKNYQALLTQHKDLVIEDDMILGEPVLTNSEFLEKEKWIKLSTCFEAKGGEDLFILGNFATDSETVYKDEPITSSDFHFIDDVGLFEISTLVPQDTQILKGYSYKFVTQAGEYFEYQGKQLEGPHFFDDPGKYPIEVYLPECGYIGTFTIEIIECDQYMQGIEQAVMEDSTFCVHEGIRVELPSLLDFKYYYNMEPIEAPEISFSEVGTHIVYSYHKECGKQDSAIYKGIDCIMNTEANCFYVPNVFTPNGDGVNDVFEIQGNCEVLRFELQIYDRWGNKVFVSQSIEDSWKGDYKGQAALSGIYVYRLLAEFRREQRIYTETMTGSVCILDGR